jgi:hypothetical protein
MMPDSTKTNFWLITRVLSLLFLLLAGDVPGPGNRGR